MVTNESLIKMSISNYSMCYDDVNSPIDMSPPHMLLPMSMCMHIEENDGFVFVVLPSKNDQLAIIFGKVRYRITTFDDSKKDLEPPQFFHYARSVHHMMKEMGYNFHRGEGLNFRKGRHIPL